MKKTKSLLPLVCGISLLQGCQTLNSVQETPMRIEPVTAIRHSADTADGLYQMGRFYQNEKRLDQAAEAYRSALAKNPEHIESRNALATVYAAQGKFDESIAELQAVLHKSPELTYVYNNLGYTHFLKKDYTAALSDFGQAIALDPANTRAFANLALVHEQLGNSAKARAASHLASAFGRLPVVAPALAAASTSSVPALPRPEGTAAEAVAPQASAMQPASSQPASSQTAEPKTAEAKADEPKIPVRQAAVSTATASLHGATAGITVEIANGTRDKALADGIAARLRGNGFAVSRISPLMPYTQHRTVILYRTGFRNQALELSRSFAVPPAIVNNTRTRHASGASNVRLVLGKASAKAVVTARLDDTTTTR